MEYAVNKRFEEVIKKLSLTQVEVAERLNVTHGTVNRWLNGHNEIRKSNAKLIAETFKLKIEWLLNGKGEMFSDGFESALKKSSTWKEESYIVLERYNESLKKEIEFLRSIITTVIPAKSFNFGNGSSGFLHEKLPISVRAVA